MLTLHFDYPSAASAVAVLRLQRIADAGGQVRFVGTDTLGLEVAVPTTLDQMAEIETWRTRAAELGLTMRRPTVRPPTLRAHLVGDLADRRGLGGSWRSTCFEAYWSDGRDLGDVEVLEDLADTAGLDPVAARAACEDRALVASGRQRAVARHRHGVGGVPVLEVDGTLLSAHLDDRELAELAAL